MELLTLILTALGSGTFMAVIMKWMDRRRDAADTRLKNAEAQKNELSNKRDEVDHYRTIINDLVTDMETLGRAQDATDKRYQENTDGLHRKVDDLTIKLDKATEIIGELRQEVRNGNDKSDGLMKELARANKTIDELKQEVKDGNAIITELRKEISELLIDRAEKK